MNPGGRGKSFNSRSFTKLCRHESVPQKRCCVWRETSTKSAVFLIILLQTVPPALHQVKVTSLSDIGMG